MVEDDVLISRAQSGDEHAFVDLMRAYHAYVFAIVIGIVDNAHDAEDVVQDAFINAYRGLSQLEDTTKFKSWLAEIARNCARNSMRKRRVDTVPIDEVSADTLRTRESPSAQLIRDEQIELIRDVMRTLPEKDREIARAYYLDGASYEELIRRHGLSYKTISFRLSRAKRTLAKRLQYLLTGAFVPPATTLKKITSGGFTAMKIGTVPKITVGVIAIVALVFIGSRQLLSPEEDSSPSVEVTASITGKPDQSGSEIDANRKNVVTAPSPADEPQISTKEMEQIEDFFAQLEADDAQSGPETPQLATEMKVNQNTEEDYTPELSATYESTMQSAEDVMNAFVDAFKNLDFEAMGLLMTGSLEEGFKKAESMGFPLMDPEESENLPAEVRLGLEKMVIEHFSRLTVVNSGYVGDEFHFELGGPPPELEIPGMVISNLDAPNELYKMRKENGLWRIYGSETLD